MTSKKRQNRNSAGRVNGKPLTGSGPVPLFPDISTGSLTLFNRLTLYMPVVLFSIAAPDMIIGIIGGNHGFRGKAFIKSVFPGRGVGRGPIGEFPLDDGPAQPSHVPFPEMSR